MGWWGHGSLHGYGVVPVDRLPPPSSTLSAVHCRWWDAEPGMKKKVAHGVLYTSCTCMNSVRTYIPRYQGRIDLTSPQQSLLLSTVPMGMDAAPRVCTHIVWTRETTLSSLQLALARHPQILARPACSGSNPALSTAKTC